MLIYWCNSIFKMETFDVEKKHCAETENGAKKKGAQDSNEEEMESKQRFGDQPNKHEEFNIILNMCLEKHSEHDPALSNIKR